MSLTFDSLDRRVIDGRGDDIAVGIDGTEITYARLVERSAAVAGGLRLLGIGPGTAVTVDLDGLDLVISVWALARIHALPMSLRMSSPMSSNHKDDNPRPTAQARMTGDPAVVIIGDERYPLKSIELTGRNDPAGAPRTDPDGYREALLAAYPNVIAPLE